MIPECVVLRVRNYLDFVARDLNVVIARVFKLGSGSSQHLIRKVSADQSPAPLQQGLRQEQTMDAAATSYFQNFLTLHGFSMDCQSHERLQ